MKVKQYLVLFALAALRGASFLFVGVAVTELSPLVIGRKAHAHSSTPESAVQSIPEQAISQKKG